MFWRAGGYYFGDYALAVFPPLLIWRRLRPNITAITTWLSTPNGCACSQSEAGGQWIRPRSRARSRRSNRRKLPRKLSRSLDLTQDPEFKPSPPSLINRIFGLFESFLPVADQKGGHRPIRPRIAAMRTATRVFNSCLEVIHLRAPILSRLPYVFGQGKSRENRE